MTETTTYFREDGAVLGDNLENIPAELKSFGHWIVHRDKKPYDAKTGQPASTTDSRTWATFLDALEAFQSGRWDGLGFVFSSGDPFFGIDLDNCRDPESGRLEGWAETILSAFPNAYREASPSERGVHIIARGKGPNRKRSQLEVYSSERYFRVTGAAL
jgi:putative DNA primase/helicase